MTTATDNRPTGRVVLGHAAAYASGLLFGAGLLVSGMTQPAKVIAFLDLLGDWDPSLALVLVGAIAVHATLFRLILRRRAPLLDGIFHVPTRRDLDGRLVLGAAVFGAGWGIAGMCPGPGLVAAATGASSALVFVAAMSVGMVAQHLMPAAVAQPARPAPTPEPPLQDAERAAAP